MNYKKLTLLSASAIFALSMLPTVSAHDGGYVADSSGMAVKDGSGDCVRSASGNIIDECEPAPAPAPVAAPAPAPAPAPVVAPAPAPKPVMKPKPRVIVLNLNETGGSNFSTGSAVLSTKAKTHLAGFARKLKASGVNPARINIVGHTDSRGSESYNQKLSVQRANSVASYLAAQGLNRGVMNVAGRGESQPVASNKTKAGRAANRRVNISASGQRRVIKQ